MKALQDKEYRQLYVDENISTGIAVQLREMRESRGWTQAELGQNANGIRQERISQLEDPEYGRPSLTTLKRLAAAFDVALIARFVEFSELVDWTINLTPEQLAPVSFDEDFINFSNAVEQVTGYVTQPSFAASELVSSAASPGEFWDRYFPAGEWAVLAAPTAADQAPEKAASTLPLGTARISPRNSYARAA